MIRKKIAVVLFNLGGPDCLNSVKPFLFNLFNDRHIVTLPQPFRYFLAKIISNFREKKSQKIYELMGGKSTILVETQEQAAALEKYLNVHSCDEKMEYTVIPMMRYWHPMTAEVVEQMKNNYDHIVLLPLYPQFSTTTTLSSLREWFKYADKNISTSTVCCYYNHPNFIKAYAEITCQTIAQITPPTNIKILFSAHSIPQHISDKGDPYEMQIKTTAQAIFEKIDRRDIKYTICYQSKIGKMKWLEPDIKSQILLAIEENETLVVVPISFTSEHSETLVELDIDYANLAKDCGVRFYRVPTVRIHPLFIKTLADLTIDSVQQYLFTNNVSASQYCSPCCNAQMCCQKIL